MPETRRRTDPRTDWRRPQFWLDRLLLAVLIVLLRAADLVVLLVRPRLLATYLRLRIVELWSSPYAALPPDPASTYGETPVVIAIWIFRRAGLGRGNQLLDLGAGRGIALLGGRFLGAQARGIEHLTSHVTAARAALRFAGAQLDTGDAEVVSWGEPTHVYLAWTCFAPATRARIVERVAELPDGTRVITIDQPIDHPRAHLLEGLRLPFPWGWVRVWIYELES